MAKLKLIVYFGDWNIGEIERWLPEEPDKHGITYKKMLIMPDEVTINAVYGGYHEFEKVAVDRKLRPTTNGDFVILKVWDKHFLPMFQYGDKNFQFVMCGFHGEETVFTRAYSEQLNIIQSRDQELESLRAEIALAGEKYDDLIKRKLHESDMFGELIESNKLIKQQLPRKDDEEENKNG